MTCAPSAEMTVPGVYGAPSSVRLGGSGVRSTMSMLTVTSESKMCGSSAGHGCAPFFSVYDGAVLSTQNVIGGTSVKRPTASVTRSARTCFPSALTGVAGFHGAPSSVAVVVAGSDASVTCMVMTTLSALALSAFGEMTLTTGGMVST